MRDFILICAVVAEFIFGYLIVKKLDVFLENNRRQISPISGTSVLRIAFETSSMVESAAEVLEQYSKKNPNCEIFLFYGSADEIEKKLAANDIDCGFVLSELQNLGKYESISIPIKLKSYIANGVGLPVVPLAAREYTTRIIWRKNESNLEVDRFVQQLK